MQNKGFWATLLVLSLALCLWGYFHPYARLGFTLLPIILCANYKVLTEEWHKGIPRWILWPWIALLLSALGHLAYGRALTDALAVVLVSMLLGVYLLARTMPAELRIRFAWLAILESIVIIIHRTYDTATWSPGLLGIFHSSAFAILVGLVLAPKRMRFWIALVALPALLVSGSEEGIAAITILLLYYLITKQATRQLLISVGLTCLVAIPLLTTGYLWQIYPRINSDRMQPDMQTLSHGRWDAYTDLAMQPKIWILGEGWYWNTLGSGEAEEFIASHPGIPLWETAHNAPMRIASQLGILAGLAWLFVFLAGLWKSLHYKAIFIVILLFAFTDHFMWTSGIAWCWTLLGVVYGQKVFSNIPIEQAQPQGNRDTSNILGGVQPEQSS